MSTFYAFLMGIAFMALCLALADDIKRLVRKEVAAALEQEPPLPEMKKGKVVA